MPRRTWTDDDLRRAIETSRTWAEVLRALGVSRGGSGRTRVRREAASLGLDTSHVRNGTGGGRRTWSDEELVDAVERASNLNQVFRSLGLSVGGGSWVAMKAHIARLELDTSHWTRDATSAARSVNPVPSWSDEDIIEAASGARSIAEVMKRLGLDPGSQRGRRQLVRRLSELGIDSVRFAGQAWAGGRKFPGRPRRPLDELLVADSTISTSKLRRRLIEEGLLPPVCASCRLERWLDGPIPLQLDHIDGDRTNNVITNLRLLCPNCHALTDTYCGRNIGRG